MIKKIIVIAKMHPDDGVTPQKIIWENNREYNIDRVLDVRKMASTKGGGAGLRYTCKIMGREKYLFFDDDVWFIEI